MVSGRRSTRQSFVQHHHAATRSRSKIGTNFLDHIEPSSGNRKALDPGDGSVRSTRCGTRRKLQLIQQKTEEYSQWQEIRRPSKKAKKNLARKSPVGTVGKKGSPIKPSTTCSTPPDVPQSIVSARPWESVEKTEEPPPGFSQDEGSPRSPTESEANAALSRHRELKRLEEEKKTTAMIQYQKTGDMSVFTPLVAPFLDGPNKPNLGSWIWDRSVERWRREHELNGEIVWGPTEDSFI